MSSSLVGSYIALQINAKAMVAEYADSPILALAKALGTQKYVALVEKVRATQQSPHRAWCGSARITTYVVLTRTL